MSWQGKKVVVTGAGGFIGSHLAEELVRRGAQVKALIHYNALGSHGWLDTSKFAKDMEIVAGDITDSDCMRTLVAGCDVVFHLAALIAIPYSYVAPNSYVRTNIDGTLNLLQASRQANIERFVHTSTSEVYGTALQVPIPETHPLQAQSPYSATKMSADKIAESFHAAFDLPVSTVRPFNTFGPRQSARAIIPTIITTCLANKPIKLGNLHPTRDLNYVSNTVDGFIKAAESKQTIGEVVNLGTGKEISIGDLAALIKKLTGCQQSIEQDDQRVRPSKSEVERLLADPSKAKKLMNWEAEVSLEEGLQKTVDWIRENLERYRPGVYTL